MSIDKKLDEAIKEVTVEYVVTIAKGEEGAYDCWADINNQRYGIMLNRQALSVLISSETKKAIREYIEPHLDYCQEQNGGSYCKNCRLSYERLDELEGEL